MPEQQLHRLGRAGQPALLAEPGQEERHQLVQVLDVMAQRRQVHRAVEETQQPGQVGAGPLAVQRQRHAQFIVPLGRPGLLQRAGQRMHLLGVQQIRVPDDQHADAVEQLAAGLGGPVLAGQSRVEHVERSGRVPPLVHRAGQSELADPALALQRQPFGRVVQRLCLTACPQPQHAAAHQARQVHGRSRRGHVARADDRDRRAELDVHDAVDER